MPNTVGLKSQGQEIKLDCGVNQKPTPKVSQTGRKQTCLIYYVADTKNFTFVKVNLHNCLMTDEEIRFKKFVNVT